MREKQVQSAQRHLWVRAVGLSWPDSTYPAAQVHREDGLLPLLQEEDDHEGERVGWDATLSLAVNVTQLWGEKGHGVRR